MFFIYIVFTMSGLILMKLEGGQVAIGIKDGIITGMIGMKLLLAFVAYGISFVIWSSIIAKNNLTYIMPLSSAVVNILSIGAGIWIFKETLSSIQILGIIIAIVGIVMMNVK